MNDVVKLLLAHRSIRQFKDKSLDQDTVNAIIASGQAAATSNNIQATTVIQVTDANKRVKLAELAGNQKYVETAGAFFVFCADLKRSAQACVLQGGDFAQGMTEDFVIATVDVALFAQNCVIAAESMGLGICYIGGLRNNPAGVSELLDIPENVYPVFGLCIGYPDQNPEVKPRLPIDAVLMQNSYDPDRLASGISTYDEQIHRYYASRSGNKKNSRWSEEMRALVGKKSRPHMREFLKAKGFTMQ